MKLFWCAAVAAALVAAKPATAGEVAFKPVDTKNLVVKPSKAAAALTASTIELAGGVAANQIENDGFVKTINNLFGFKKTTTSPVQRGPSAIPAPGLFPSTQYRSPLQPVMPVMSRSRP